MSNVLAWPGAIVGSALVHAVFFAVFAISVEPGEVKPQHSPETRLNIDAYELERNQATAQEIDGETAEQRQTEGQGLNANSIPQSRTESATPVADSAPIVKATGAEMAAVQPAAMPVPALQDTTPTTPTTAPTPTPISSMATTALRADAVSARPEILPEVGARIAALAELEPPTSVLSATESTSIAVAAADTPALVLAANALVATQTAAVTIPANTANEARPAALQVAAGETAEITNAQTAGVPKSDTLPEVPAGSQQLAAATLPAERDTALPAWQFGDRVVTDPTSLATIQAFLTPDQINGGDNIKDGLTDTLTSFDCARISATFIPETGAIEMRGHVPDPAMRAQVVAAMQAQVGEGIRVTGNLRHLPAPQCGALSGISSVGLPQSTDQFTNERLVGADAHAREYRYSEGQRLQFDLGAPDYDAYIYVDYFDAEGQVIHLVPNEFVALEQHAAKSSLGVGASGPGQPGLIITIGPPYGQEIAVAFATTTQLFDEPRPLVEPAAPYLDDMKSRIARLRDENSDFKGEWVYFFIETAPATQ